MGYRIVSLFRDSLSSGEFPDAWKQANLVLIRKKDKPDSTNAKSYRPVSLLPVLSKALETLIAARLKSEIDANMCDRQYGFTANKSTLSAIDRLDLEIDSTRNRYVLGTFLDITGAFDNLSWDALLKDLVAIGASYNSLRMIRSYLANRTALLEIEGVSFTKQLRKGCPQGSQLGPLLWNVAANAALAERDTVTIAYADDLVVLAGAARIPKAIDRTEKTLAELSAWATLRGLSFSTSKSQTMCLKGGRKPDFAVRLSGNIITATDSVRYLGITLDRGKTFWPHVDNLAENSMDLFSRLRGLTSANWGLNQSTSRIIYKAVFIPRITYGARIWESGAKTKKAISKLGSVQRRGLLAVTGAYRTTSTHALQAIAGLLPLDLEVRKTAARQKELAGLITNEQRSLLEEELLDTWQSRWSNSSKGSWTKKLIPDVKLRYRLDMTLDHYTSQLLSGHGDFLGRLHSFKLVESPNCRCGHGSETVQHVIYACRRTEEPRQTLKRVMLENNCSWPPESGEFLKTRITYEALRTFARSALKNRTDR
jgi:hypothetical protein